MDGITILSEQQANEIWADRDEVVGERPLAQLVERNKEFAIGGAYEGSDQFNRWLAAWQPGLGSADSDMLPAKLMADSRSRDLHRNDGYVQSGATITKDSIVGGMYMANSKPDMTVLGIDDEKWCEEFQEEVEAKFTIAAESPNCYFDAARSLTFTGIIRLAVGMASYGGEYLGVPIWDRDRGRPFKTAIQTIELDRLMNPYSGVEMGRIVRGGVHQNHRGAPLGYYIRKAHLMDWDTMLDAHQFDYIPVRKPWGRLQVIHLKDQLRPNQTRAVADIVAGLKEIKITKKFRELVLQQAVVQAMFAASIESDLPPAEAFAALGAGREMDFGQAIAEYGTKYLAAINHYVGKRGIRLDNVKIPHFFPGSRLNFKNVGAPGGIGMEFEQSLLRYIASLLGVSYEQLSKDFSKTNYSSARAGLTESWKTMQSKKKLFADRLATIIYMLWFEEAMNAGQLETMKYSKLPNYYEGLNAEAYTACEWIGASRGQIDELKETQAAVLRIKFGLSTHEEELAKLGKDWRRVYRQLERERIEREARGIILLEDNSMNAASGSPRETDRQGTEGADDTGADQNV